MLLWNVQCGRRSGMSSGVSTEDSCGPILKTDVEMSAGQFDAFILWIASGNNCVVVVPLDT